MFTCSQTSLRRREAGWGATGGERTVRRITNSIRPDGVASLLANGEAQTRVLVAREVVGAEG
jgi:hypothetical protein